MTVSWLKEPAKILDQAFSGEIDEETIRRAARVADRSYRGPDKLSGADVKSILEAYGIVKSWMLTMKNYPLHYLDGRKDLDFNPLFISNWIQ